MISNFFNNFGNSASKRVFEDLLIQDIKIRGLDFVYIVRERWETDPIFGEDLLSKFSDAGRIEMLPTEGNFKKPLSNQVAFNPFGPEWGNDMSMVVSNTRFRTEIGFDNPVVGDLLYSPLNRILLEITHINTDDDVLFSYGTSVASTLRTKLFVHDQSNEMTTGISTIDSLNSTLDDARNIDRADNQDLSSESDQIVHESDQQVSNLFGEF